MLVEVEVQVKGNDLTATAAHLAWAVEQGPSTFTNSDMEGAAL